MLDTVEKPETLLSVVIVSYENYPVLKNCLESIRLYNDIGPQLEIVVVEQSDGEAIYKAITNDFPEVIAVRNKNEGFGAGNNVGAAISTGKYLLFLNPDTLLLEPIFKFACETFKSNPNIGLFGVRLLDAEGGKNRSFHFRKPYGLLHGVLWRLFDRCDIYLDSCMYIAGADMFMSSNVFKATGGFDSSMFMYFEETYISIKINELGYKTSFFPGKKIVHLEGQSSKGVNTLSRQLDALEILCTTSSLSFERCLRKMAYDRKVKLAFRYGDAAANESELLLLKDRLQKYKKGGRGK